jgi:hypothetical protein
VKANHLPVVLLLALAVLPACKTKEAQGPVGLGRPVAEGPARAVQPAPDGEHLAYVADPRPAKELGQGDVPDSVWLGTAQVVPTAGGAPLAIGQAVSTLPGSIVFDATGARVLALADFQFKSQSGTLMAGDVATGKVRALAPAVTFFGFSPDGKRLGYVSKDTLFVGPADGSAPPVALGAASTFEFSADGGKVLFRRKMAQDGSLLVVTLPEPGAPAPTPRALAKAVADYNWSPNGDRIAFTARVLDSTDLFVAPADGEPKKLASGVTSFAFSGDGKHLAFLAGIGPNKQFGDLFLLADGATAPAKLGEQVNEWSFGPGSKEIGWIEKYEPTGRVGTLAYAAATATAVPKRLGGDVASFLWSRTGTYLAYLQRTLRPVFSVDLFLEKVGGEGPRKVASGVFGYDFGKGDEAVLYRHNCVRNGRACDLSVVPTARLEAPPKRLATGVFTFEFDNDLQNLMLTYARIDADALDLAVMPVDGSRPPVTIDQFVAPGTKWVGKDRIAYAELGFKRQGIYVADLAALPPPAPAAAER